MCKKIIGITVGTAINPDCVLEKAAQSEQIKKNTEDIGKLSEDVETLRSNVGEAVESAVELIGGKVGRDELTAILGNMFEPITQDEYDALVTAGTVDLSRPYFIKKETV